MRYSLANILQKTMKNKAKDSEMEHLDHVLGHETKKTAFDFIKKEKNVKK